MNTFSGNIVDVVAKRIFRGRVEISDGKIQRITEEEVDGTDYIMPGFVDSHIHIESSMLIPSEFARLAVVHGTVATVSDPHEIANVVGIEGVKYMINNGKKVPFKFNFGAPSCVPATVFETAGAEIDVDDIKELLAMDDIRYLTEMMNFPGVLMEDEMVMAKLQAAKDNNKVVDGHAPGLRGEDARKYIEAGISTDHECYTTEEALDKIKYGMKILIREGSAAKNFEALIELLDQHPDMIMFCSDDKHPNELAVGHIDILVRRALEKGYDLMSTLRAATLNPIQHYGLDVGLLQEEDPADFILVEDLNTFKIKATYIDGKQVSAEGRTLIESIPEVEINQFNCQPIGVSAIAVKAESEKVHVIEALDGQLITNDLILDAKNENGNLVSDVDNDILKMVVVNRYATAPPAIAFVRNFGIKEGAIASSVAHDSHNIIAVGANDEEIVKSINSLIPPKGGISLCNKDKEMVLGLPVGGLMSTEDGYKIADLYENLDKEAKTLGSTLGAPYMTLSFLALLVIPNLKLSDKGLFNGEKFEFTSLFA